MSNKKKPPMGHDPLAWMSEVDTASESVTTENSDKIKQDVVLSNTEDSQAVEAKSVANESEPSLLVSNVDIPPLTTGWITVTLDSNLTLSNLPQLHKKLCQYQGKRIELIGDRVTHVDTATLQLLFAFISSADITVSWKKKPSDEIINAAHLLGLSQQLSLQSIE